MHGELWDTESGNLVESFATEADGLRGARDVLAANAPDFAEHLALGVVGVEGESAVTGAPPVLEGAMLTDRINQLSAEPRQPHAAEDNGAYSSSSSQTRRASR